MNLKIDKEILDKIYPNREFDKNLEPQYYQDMVDFIHDYNLDKINFEFPIQIQGIELKHFQKRKSGLTLVFEMNEEQQPIIQEMKRISELQGGHWFNIHIVTYKDVARILKTFDVESWLKLEVSIPSKELTTKEKIETDEIIERKGGPISSIEYLITTLSKDNRGFIISQIYYILDVRSTSVETVNEILYKDDLRIDWSLISNKHFN
jgi:hypothetical protein